MKKIGLVPEREWAYLLRSGKHSFSCLKGDVIGQVHTNDLSEDKVYYIRKCNVCGDPFADGSYVHDPIEGLASYVARSESEEKSLDHLHVYGLNNDKADVVRLQPNFFLRGYNPHGLKVERIIPEERRIRVPWIFAPVIGRRDETEGSLMLESVYEKYYDKLRSIPPIIGNLITRRDLVPGVNGKKFYKDLEKSMKNANKIGLKKRLDFKLEDLNRKILRWRGKEVLDLYKNEKGR